jgi:DnaJ homolog subfamily C member 28
MNEKKNELPVENPQELAEYRVRLREDRQSLIEELIQEAQENGLFDNLPGKGKPLNLNKNLYAADMELANELLKENDLPPAWILQRNEILDKIAKIRMEIKQQWERQQQEFAIATTNKGELTIRWDNACLSWIDEITALNKGIDRFNLKRPFDNLEIFKLSLENELKRANASRWLL